VVLRLEVEQSGRRGGLDGEEEDPEPERGPAGGAGGGVEQVEAIVLEDEVLEVLIVGEGDERVEVLPRQLVLCAELPDEAGDVRGEAGRRSRRSRAACRARGSWSRR
jgi:hypothetical protein